MENHIFASFFMVLDLRLVKIGCRETINFFFYIRNKRSVNINSVYYSKKNEIKSTVLMINDKMIRKTLMIALLMVMGMVVAKAQGGLKKVYDETIDPMHQIEAALTKAKEQKKYVLCQVGGNWCPWCLRFADFVEKDSVVSKTVNDNYVFIHVNYDPRRTSVKEKQAESEHLMHYLGNPARFGFPVFVVLNDSGSVLHIQDSSYLEEGKGYSKEKTLRFFKNWTPEVVKK